MRCLLPVVLFCILGACASDAASRDTDTHVRHVTWMLGQRELDDGTAQFLDLDEQSVFGVEIDRYERSSGHGFEFGYLHSSQDDSFAGFGTEAVLDELYAGYRLTLRSQADDWQPYFAIGASLVRGEFDIGPVSDDDTDLGAYARAGLAWRLGESGRLGVEYRRLFGADLDLLGGSAEADHDQWLLSWGMRF